jgi:alkylation response protein AidB-like acyl-CoA dehydrogenase
MIARALRAASKKLEGAMNFELVPATEPGRRFTVMAEEHATVFAARAGEYDRDGSSPLENIEDMKRSGAMLATVPAELGGLGLESLHDFAIGMNRIGRRALTGGRCLCEDARQAC